MKKIQKNILEKIDNEMAATRLAANWNNQSLSIQRICIRSKQNLKKENKQNCGEWRSLYAKTNLINIDDNTQNLSPKQQIPNDIPHISNQKQFLLNSNKLNEMSNKKNTSK